MTAPSRVSKIRNKRYALQRMRSALADILRLEEEYDVGQQKEIFAARAEGVEQPDIIGRVRWNKSLAADKIVSDARWAHMKAQTFAAVYQAERANLEEAEY